MSDSEGVPSAYPFFHTEPALLNPHPGKEILFSFELLIVTFTSRTERHLELGFWEALKDAILSPWP